MKNNVLIYRYPAIAYFTVLLLFLFADSSILRFIYAFLLILPLFDSRWSIVKLSCLHKKGHYWLLLVLLSTVLILLFHSSYIEYYLLMLVFTALPEEWFFRGYLLSRLDDSAGDRPGNKLLSNILVSLAFSLLHGITQNMSMMFLVFVPSICFGWVYQKTENLCLTALLHALSNLIFIVYLQDIISPLIHN